MNSPSVSKKFAKSNHQELYKSPMNRNSLEANQSENGNQNDSPSWRNVYKKRCFDEFKKSRQKLVNKFRTLDVI
jgi:hypothetical protein